MMMETARGRPPIGHALRLPRHFERPRSMSRSASGSIGAWESAGPSQGRLDLRGDSARMPEPGRAIPCSWSPRRRCGLRLGVPGFVSTGRLPGYRKRNNRIEKGDRMKLMRSVLALAGLGLLGTLAMGSVAAFAQSATAADPSKSAKIGSSLIGKLEGPEIILDAKAYPKTFKEAPTLAEQGESGESCPPSTNACPSLHSFSSWKPLNEIGKYGGNWRRAFTGPADHEERQPDQFARQDPDLRFTPAPRSFPSLARDWKVSDDGQGRRRSSCARAPGGPTARRLPRTISCSGIRRSISTRTSIPRRSSNSRSTARTG